MAEPFLAEIRIMSFDFAPKGWAMCNGQLMPINQNQALFSLLGTNYGGDGRVNFGLPDLRGRVPGHWQGGSFQTLGQRGGEQAHTLTQAEMPAHTHSVMAKKATADAVGGNLPGNANKVMAQGIAAAQGTPAVNVFGAGPPNIGMSVTGMTNTGGSQAHLNMQPFLVLTFCIALQGIFPSQN